MEGLAGQSDLPASSLDIPATLTALVGIQPPATWAGRDLLAALRRDPTVRHKLIVWKNPAKPDELYDLTVDPAEEKNLYDTPEVQEIRKDLEARLQAWMERTEDPARQWPKVGGGTAPKV